MKKYFPYILLFLCLMALAGCTQNSDVPSASSAAIAAPEPTDSSDVLSLDFSAQYIRAGSGAASEKYPSVRVIRSSSDLTAYDETPGYDDAFFQAHALLLVCLLEPSGSIRHEVTSVTSDGHVLTASINRERPEIGTDDMAAWHILIELPADIPGDVELQLTETPLSE